MVVALQPDSVFQAAKDLVDDHAINRSLDRFYRF
jgi:hypothetical protein